MFLIWLNSCPTVGTRPLLQFHDSLRGGPILLTPLFFPLAPSSYRVLCGSCIFPPLARYSCLLSVIVLHALLHSWCIHGERGIPHPPAPPPSCSPKQWKILKVIGIPATLPASWETCMQVKRQQLESDMEQQTGSKLGKKYVKGVCCHPA